MPLYATSLAASLAMIVCHKTHAEWEITRYGPLEYCTVVDLTKHVQTDREDMP